MCTSNPVWSVHFLGYFCSVFILIIQIFNFWRNAHIQPCMMCTFFRLFLLTPYSYYSDIKLLEKTVPVATGMGFPWVWILIPIPIPVENPWKNPWITPIHAVHQLQSSPSLLHALLPLIRNVAINCILWWGRRLKSILWGQCSNISRWFLSNC